MEQAYARSDLFEKRANAMQQWATYLDEDGFESARSIKPEAGHGAKSSKTNQMQMQEMPLKQ